MKMCVVKDISNGDFFGKEYDEGYHYSEYTHSDAAVNATWKPLKFYLEDDNSCGLIIFESAKKARGYMNREWPSYPVEVVNLGDL